MSIENNDDNIDNIVEYTPSQQSSNNHDFDISNSDKEKSRRKKTIISNTDDTEENKKQSEILMDLAHEYIDLSFKDQYGEGFVRILNNDHKEIIPINSSKFARFLSKIYYENGGEI